MPYQWIDPELFLEYQGVAIYRCYDDDSVVSACWYTTEVTDCNIDSPLADGAQFDVRDLPDLGLDAGDANNHTAIIQHAISQALISGEPAVRTEPPRLVVKVEVLGGVAYVVEQPPGVEVEIVDHDVEEVAEEDPCNPDKSQAPDLETLMQWEAEGGCEATDGCWVEPDGVCEHGCKSWLLVMGLI
jgi:hypothetical protein